MENSGGEGGLAILEFGGQGGDKHFGISEGKGGLKYSCHPWYITRFSMIVRVEVVLNSTVVFDSDRLVLCTKM